MGIFADISNVIAAIVQTVIAVIAVLMIVRLAINYMDVNPFGRTIVRFRQLTDPLVNPARRALAGFGINQKIAPLITLLIAILLGYFVVQLTDSAFGGLRNIVVSAQSKQYLRVLGFALYTLLDIYGLLLFIRIIFSWGMVISRNSVMRFLVGITDPLLIPLRRMIPPLGVFDLSAIFAFLLIWLFQAAIRGTLLRGVM